MRGQKAKGNKSGETGKLGSTYSLPPSKEGERAEGKEGGLIKQGETDKLECGQKPHAHVTFTANSSINFFGALLSLSGGFNYISPLIPCPSLARFLANSRQVPAAKKH